MIKYFCDCCGEEVKKFPGYYEVISHNIAIDDQRFIFCTQCFLKRAEKLANITLSDIKKVMKGTPTYKTRVINILGSDLKNIFNGDIEKFYNIDYEDYQKLVIEYRKKDLNVKNYKFNGAYNLTRRAFEDVRLCIKTLKKGGLR